MGGDQPSDPFPGGPGVGNHGSAVQGPPWLLGHRGAPKEAPENTLSSLQRALEWGLDGVEYDLQACASGEPVLLHDETLERTTDGHGPVSTLTLPELTGLDAGGWFHKRFVGEPVPLLEEALELPGREPGVTPIHMIELKDPKLAGEVARQVSEVAQALTVRIASFHRSVCLEAQDAGLPSMLLSVLPNPRDLAFVRDEGVAAYGLGPGGWSRQALEEEWPCERWGWSIDDPEELLRLTRHPLFGFNTNEPRRALAVRALVALTPGDEGAYPVQVPPLMVEQPVVQSHGGWSGDWSFEVRLRNPFGFATEIALALAVRGGAFEVEGLPAQTELGAGEEVSLPVRLRGGSWSPGEDPLLYARFVWGRGPGRERGELILDAPMNRTRAMTLRKDALRVPMLQESPHQPQASMAVWRRGGEVLARIEDAAGLEDLRAVLRLGAEVGYGGRAVRAALPADFDARREGLPFSVGFIGYEQGERCWRRWSGGLPPGLGAGAPGLLYPSSRG